MGKISCKAETLEFSPCVWKLSFQSIVLVVMPDRNTNSCYYHGRSQSRNFQKQFETLVKESILSQQDWPPFPPISIRLEIFGNATATFA